MRPDNLAEMVPETGLRNSRCHVTAIPTSPPISTRPAAAPPVVGLIGAIGNTPLVRLDHFLVRTDVTLYAKLEYLNPGGSMKDRPAAYMLQRALDDGRLTSESTVVESSSGNMAIGIAQFCRVHKIRFRCVADIRIQPQNLAILRALGAEIDLVTEPDPATGDFLRARLDRVARFLAETPGAFWPNQYANPHNPEAHELGTMREIDDALGGDIDVVFVATSSTGTAGGCADYLRARGRPTRVVAVDAVGSVLFGGRQGERMIPGLGAGTVPPLAASRSFDQVERVTDSGCVAGCRRLVHTEGLLVGGSAGGVLHTVRAQSPMMPAGAVVVAVLPDSGTRYLDTVFDDDWVADRLELTPERLADLTFDHRL